MYGRIPPKEPSSNITCPSCGRAVGASRFAPHLDKCVLGPSRVRSSRSARSSVSDCAIPELRTLGVLIHFLFFYMVDGLIFFLNFFKKAGRINPENSAPKSGSLFTSASFQIVNSCH